MDMTEARELAAQAWCRPTTSHRAMDPELAEEFARILMLAVNPPLHEEGELRGTMECPICGHDRPHGHAQAEIDEHNIATGKTPQTPEEEASRLVGIVSMRLDWREILVRDICALVRKHVSAAESRVPLEEK